MKTVNFGLTQLQVPNIILGCMRMEDKTLEEASHIIQTAYNAGITMFDHADIYGKGQSEIIFGQAIKHLGINREDIVIQSKCGIRDGYFDFSKEHILNSVDLILERLGTDYLDILLLHRPDALVEPKEVNEAFNILLHNGKVRHFGVSNQSPLQVELLQKYLDVKLEANQLQLSLKHTNMFDFGFNVNNYNESAVDRTGSIVEYSRIHDMTIQAWSPFFAGYFESIFMDNTDFPVLNESLKKMGAKYECSAEAIAVAWILRHPAKMQAIIGSMNADRIERICVGSEIELSREDWYSLYRDADNLLP